MVNELKITIIPSYDGQPLQTFKNYSYTDDSQISFDKIKLFLSNIRLEQGNASMLLQDIASMNFETDFSDLQSAATGQSLLFEDLNSGVYTFRFGIGVEENLNATDPSSYNIDHPLGEGSDYWGPWQSYIFTKHEGKFTRDTVTNFVYHTGSDACYFEQSAEISLNKEEEEIMISIDFKEVFRQDDGTLMDIPSEPVLHRLTQTDLAIFFCENLRDATSINMRN
jgi:hypothetical protein